MEQQDVTNEMPEYLEGCVHGKDCRFKNGGYGECRNKRNFDNHFNIKLSLSKVSEIDVLIERYKVLSRELIDCVDALHHAAPELNITIE